MQNDKNTPIRPAAARSRGGLLNAALLSAVLVSAALLSGLFLGGCSSPLDAGANGGGGNVTLTFGKSDGRTITSGVDLPADVLASMRFEAKLSGPNREALTLNAKWGETTKLKLRQGKWRIDAKAYQADSPNLAGTGSISFDIKDRNNKIIVPMAMRDTAGAPLSCYEIHVPGFANGQVEASFTAAYPGTTVTLTTAPAGGYILHSLTYTDGTATHTPAGGGNEYTFTMPDADVTVSAVFIHPFYTITYSAGTGSGTVPAPVVIESGTSIPLPAGSAPSGGIPFHSWEMGGTVYTAGASYTVTGDVTLTARWAF
ncbi:MAG: InlB B-repeat-containing protein, partial [Treponema sp.]|nr:InlB B-repeat-containing protein [Treponema sp.]